MGCANSKQKRCRHCQGPYSPVSRSYSMHVVHPPQQRGDSYHVVALTSTTLGSLALDSSANHHKDNPNGSVDSLTFTGNHNDIHLHHHNHQKVNGYNDHENLGGVANGKEMNNKISFSMGLIEAKTWSSMIQEKIPRVAPRTPVMTPPGEPETINAWELMAGLEDNSSPPLNLPHRFRSFSFDVSRETTPVLDSPKLSLPQHQQQLSSPNGLLGEIDNNNIMCVQMADGDADSQCPEFDPEVISTFRQSLQELSPSHPFYIKPLPDCQKQQALWTKHDDANTVDENFVKKDQKRVKDKVVIYFTSLRGVRKTYEDCCHVRVILKGFGVRVDERDVSMHSGFKEELRDLLGEGFNGGGLPRVFVGKKYIGSAEEIRRMHEEGQLEKVVEGCEMVDDDGVGGGGACEACGDMRFVPCETCSGSCKIYYEANEEEQEEEELQEHDEEDRGEYGFQRCPDCNENGLIRCPICCD